MAYESAMEKIYTKYPDDLEAAAFYALAVDQDALPTDKTFANQLKAAAILEASLPDRTGSSWRHALSDSQLRRSVARRARSALRPAVRGSRTRRAARPPHAGAHVYARGSLAGVDRHQHSIARRRHQARRFRRSAARHGLHDVRVPPNGAGYGGQARRRRTGADSGEAAGGGQRSWNRRRISSHSDSRTLCPRTQSLVRGHQSPGPSRLAALHRSDDPFRARDGRRPPRTARHSEDRARPACDVARQGDRGQGSLLDDAGGNPAAGASKRGCCGCRAARIRR